MLAMKRGRNFLLAVAMALLLFVGGALALDSFAPSSVGLEAVHAQGGVTGFANLRITNFYRAAPRSAITVTVNGTLNATGTNQRIQAAFPGAATSGANITVKPAGTLLILTNVSTNTITFTETGTLISAGNIALGANDAATLLSDGTNWTQIAASNN